MTRSAKVGYAARAGSKPTLTGEQVGDQVLLVVFELHAGHRTVPGELPGVVADELNGARVHAVVAVGCSIDLAVARVTGSWPDHGRLAKFRPEARHGGPDEAEQP